MNKDITTAYMERENTASVLDWKMEEAKTKNLPVEETLADYIALGVQNFDDKIAQLKAYKQSIDEHIKVLEEHKKDAMFETLEWMQGNGISKLKGIHVSSITCKDADISIRKKFVIDVDKEDLVAKGFAHWEEDIQNIKPTIKVNKRRAK